MFNVSTSRLPRLAFTSALLAAAAALCAPRAQAQTAPPGAILDIAAASPGSVLSSYRQFTASFVAASSSTTVSFAFRDQPGYFSFDDAFVAAAGSTTNLLADPGFESATVGATIPTGWGSFSQPVAVTATGSVASNAALGGCAPNGAHSGSQFWCAGPVEGYAGLYQTLATTVSQTYNVSFYLVDNSGYPLNNPPSGSLTFAVDALVYAQAGLPSGTVSNGFASVPEPASLALLGTGLLGLLASARRRRQARLGGAI